MSATDNPFVAMIEESIHLRDSAQKILSEALGGNTVTRLERLVLLVLTGAGQPLTVSQIGRNLGHSRQVIQRAVNQLIELEMLEKQPNPHHKTSPLIAPTAKGTAFEQQMSEKLVEIVSSLLTRNDLGVCQRIRRDLNGLRKKIEACEQ